VTKDGYSAAVLDGETLFISAGYTAMETTPTSVHPSLGRAYTDDTARIEELHVTRRGVCADTKLVHTKAPALHADATSDVTKDDAAPENTQHMPVEPVKGDKTIGKLPPKVSLEPADDKGRDLRGLETPLADPTRDSVSKFRKVSKVVILDTARRPIWWKARTGRSDTPGYSQTGTE
jgi:hypothetical protein